MTEKLLHIWVFYRKDITMPDNIFKRLRLEKTERTVMRGEGKKIAVKKPLTTTQLAKELHISQSTVDNAERGIVPSLSTIDEYHNYFHVPYSTLLGETECENIDNLHINMELGLSDASITTIKSLSPIARTMLNTFLGQNVNTELLFYNLADIIYSMTERLKQNGNNKNEDGYLKLKQMAVDLFLNYMKNITFGDLKNVLLQLEHQQELIDCVDISSDPTTK